MAFIGLHSIKRGEDHQEFGKWLAFHHCTPRWMPTDDGEVLLVKIPLVCKHLSYDNDGLAGCKIYEKRPKICQDHKCNKVREYNAPGD
jgi:Fe-S-cluster containining protein